MDKLTFDIESVSIHDLLAAVAEGTLELGAPYKHRPEWSAEYQRRLIGSALLGIPVGQLLLAALDSSGPGHRVVDGGRRLEALDSFASGAFSVPSKWWRPDEHTSDADEGPLRPDHRGSRSCRGLRRPRHVVG